MAYPTVESITTTNFTSDTTSHNANMPATVTAGDLLVAICGFDADAATRTVTPPTGWVKHAEYCSVNTGLLAICIRRADGTEGGGTADFQTDAVEQGTVQVYRISGAARVERDVIGLLTASVSGPRVWCHRGFAADRLIIGATVKSNLSGWTADTAGWSGVTTTGADSTSSAALRTARATSAAATGPHLSHLPSLNGAFMMITIVGTGWTVGGEVTLSGSPVSGAQVLVIESEDADGFVTPRVAGVADTNASGEWSMRVADGVRVSAMVYRKDGPTLYTAPAHHSIEEA